MEVLTLLDEVYDDNGELNYYCNDTDFVMSSVEIKMILDIRNLSKVLESFVLNV